jgi:hypothetical protein
MGNRPAHHLKPTNVTEKPGLVSQQETKIDKLIEHMAKSESRFELFRQDS